MCPSTAPLQGGLCSGRLAEQSPLTGYEPKVSHRSQQRKHYNYLTVEKRQSRHERWRSRDHLGCVWSLRHNRRGTVDCTTVLSGARSKCHTIQCLFVLTHIQAWRNPGETLSSFQASGTWCRKVKEIEIWESARFSNGKGKNSVRTKRPSRLPWKESRSCFLRRMRSSDKINWSAVLIGQKKMENARCWCCSFWNWHAAPDQTRREKSWLGDAWEMRNRAVQEDHARNCQDISKKLKNYEEFAVHRLRELDNWGVTNSLRIRMKVNLLWVSSWLRFRICRTR